MVNNDCEKELPTMSATRFPNPSASKSSNVSSPSTTNAGKRKKPPGCIRRGRRRFSILATFLTTKEVTL